MQVYVGGEFIGGADVCRELAESGELQVSLSAPLFPTQPPVLLHHAYRKVGENV